MRRFETNPRAARVNERVRLDWHPWVKPVRRLRPWLQPGQACQGLLGQPRNLPTA